LVVLNAIAAQEHGAIILTHTECLAAQHEQNQWKITLKNHSSGETQTLFAKCLVNASGPWTSKISTLIPGATTYATNLVKGSHIVVPRLYDGDFAYILQTDDKRIVFAIPYQDDFTLIGTTDVAYADDLNHVAISAEEKNYLCDTINHYFKKTLSVNDIAWSYAGVRCLQASNAEHPAEISRDYQFQLQTENQLLTVVSGKLTTYRRLAEEAVDSLRAFFPLMKTAWTAHKPLPGGDFAETTLQNFYENLCAKYAWLPQKIAYRYARSYGTRAEMILANTSKLADLGEMFGAGLYQKEVEYLIAHEWAVSCEDILWRRSKLGLVFSAEEVAKLQEWLNQLSFPHRRIGVNLRE
jgi:glycerol-3-phosphate dehydrogenase